jgi:MFS family permease
VLFLSTVINYIDWQTLNVLVPYIKLEFHWNNSDFAWLIISFRVAYAFGQTLTGRLLNWIGTRRGLSISAAFLFCGRDADVACLRFLAVSVLKRSATTLYQGEGDG